MRVRVVPYARIREIVGSPELERDEAPGATALDVWRDLARAYPGLAALDGSTRFVRNGELVERAQPLADGDELGLLPPYGGG
jgi:molybdopterin converting factor small subunit